MSSRSSQVPNFVRLFSSLGFFLWMVVQLLETQHILVSSPDSESHGTNDELLSPLDGLNSQTQKSTLQVKDWHLEQRFEHRDYKMLLDFVDAGPETSCPEGLVLVPDTRLFNDSAWNSSAIPKIVHVTAKSRCMTETFSKNLDKWRLPGYSLLVHNDAAVDAFLDRYWPEFPELPKVVHCLLSGAGKADLWRALMLWEYGGMYTDIDGAPNKLFRDGRAIADDDEAFFVVEKGGWLSQYFMCSMPHHPLMYLVVSKIIQRLYSLNDVDGQYVPRSTGPGPVKYAFITFMNDQGGNFYEGVGDCNSNRKFKYGHVTAGKYTGWDNRTVTVVGEKQRADDVIRRYSIKSKVDGFHNMNMTHFSESKRSSKEKQTCFRRIYVRDQWPQRHHAINDSRTNP